MITQRLRFIVPIALIAAIGAGCAHGHRATGPQASTTETTVSNKGQETILSPSASPRGVVRQAVTGVVKKVDRNSGTVIVRTGDGKDAEFVLPPFAVATVNEGDRATFDITFTPR
jgi:hypothetical protein